MFVRGREKRIHRIWAFWAALTAAQVLVPARADQYDDTLLTYAVNIHLSSATKSWSGYGIYLGHGFFITAAHVIGKAWITKPKIAILDKEYPTTVVKEV